MNSENLASAIEQANAIKPSEKAVSCIFDKNDITVKSKNKEQKNEVCNVVPLVRPSNLAKKTVIHFNGEKHLLPVIKAIKGVASLYRHETERFYAVIEENECRRLYIAMPMSVDEKDV